MALIVENGTGMANAESYVSVADATVILQSFPEDVDWEVLETSEKEARLKMATQYIDIRYRFYGIPLNPTVQALQWPRTKNYNNLNTVFVAGVIPVQLKKATSIIAGKKEIGYDAIPPGGPVTRFRSENVDLYWAGGQSAMMGQFAGTRYPEVEMLLRSIGELRTEASMVDKGTE